MKKSIFEVTKMDCPSEEHLIRMKLAGFPTIKKLDFNLKDRQLTVYHDEQENELLKSLNDLNLHASLLATEQLITEIKIESPEADRKLLWIVLLINFGFFVIESTSGLISKSLGLVADSLDMLADAFVYGLSLFAISRSIQAKKNVARISGYFQLLLALTGFYEVSRRYLKADSPPDFMIMIIVSLFALAANGFCMYLLRASKSDDAHMKASMIFTSNDMIINMGVIVAGALVFLTDSNKPDLIIGLIVFLVVTRVAFRILNLARS